MRSLVKDAGCAREHDGTVKERLVAAVGKQVSTDRNGTGRLTHRRHFVCIASKLGNVGANPLEGHLLIEQTNIKGTGGGEIDTAEETKHTETVVDGDDDCTRVDFQQ